mmetsp:Transcript_29114/g.84632  ORF Transcript_29114/g.84632 Transcript_29114/m.84632 type:complete len:243 (-) Transcript_29114:262-990(-)
MAGLESKLVTKSSSASTVTTHVLMLPYRSSQLGSLALGKDTLIQETPVSNLLRRPEVFLECLPLRAVFSEPSPVSVVSTAEARLSSLASSSASPLPGPIPISPSLTPPVMGSLSSNARLALGNLYQSAPVIARSSAVPLRPINILRRGRRSDRAGRPRGTPCLVLISGLRRCANVGMNPSMETTAPSSRTRISRPSPRATPMHCGAGSFLASSPSFLSSSPAFFPAFAVSFFSSSSSLSAFS